jgi:hypothetical protein
LIKIFDRLLKIKNKKENQEKQTEEEEEGTKNNKKEKIETIKLSIEIEEKTELKERLTKKEFVKGMKIENNNPENIALYHQIFHIIDEDGDGIYVFFFCHNFCFILLKFVNFHKYIIRHT